jgi:hypothetical protein
MAFSAGCSEADVPDVPGGTDPLPRLFDSAGKFAALDAGRYTFSIADQHPCCPFFMRIKSAH